MAQQVCTGCHSASLSLLLLESSVLWDWACSCSCKLSVGSKRIQSAWLMCKADCWKWFKQLYCLLNLFSSYSYLVIPGWIIASAFWQTLLFFIALSHLINNHTTALTSFPSPPQNYLGLKDGSLLFWFSFWARLHWAEKVSEHSRKATDCEVTQKCDCKGVAPATEMHLRNFGPSQSSSNLKLQRTASGQETSLF